jgi:hypothetical protein
MRPQALCEGDERSPGRVILGVPAERHLALKKAVSHADYLRTLQGGRSPYALPQRAKQPSSCQVSYNYD